MRISLLFIGLFISLMCLSQPSFSDYQKNFPRVAKAIQYKEDTLRKQFSAAGLTWPAKEIYIRSFKYDSQLEVWARNNDREPFKLFKTYKVCALAGAMGPKRIEGDYQVPEGFYYINEFKPVSNYHLALGINYPNASDKILGDSKKPGGDIYIHGSCITVGCIPIQDQQIEELYLLAASAKNSGQDFIPVHIFPVKFNNKRSMEYFSQATREDQELQKFAVSLKDVYDYFEKEKLLPLISINREGKYVLMN